jgi:predicted nucleic acid-binding protein
MLAFDTNILIYVLEDNSEFGEKARKLLRENKYNAVVSELIYAEILSSPKLQSARNKKIVFDFLKAQRLEFVTISREVLVRAAELRATYTPKLGLGDALHLSAAIQAKASEFITNDKDLTKLSIPGLKIRLL